MLIRKPTMLDMPVSNAYLSSCVDMTGRITDGDSTNNLSMVQRVDLTCMARNPWTNQCIRRKGNRLHLSFSTNVERVCSLIRQKRYFKHNCKRGETGMKCTALRKIKPAVRIWQEQINKCCLSL